MQGGCDYLLPFSKPSENSSSEGSGEWQGETPAVGAHNFDWTHHVVCDMTEVAFVRIELAGSNDSYVALAETKEHLAKKISYVFGGWNNAKSIPFWINKGVAGQFSQGN